MPSRSLAVVAVLLLAEPIVAQPLLDALGDPLPPGAVARLGTLRMQHATSISSAVLAPDGGTVYSAAVGDPLVRAWDAATGKEVRRFAVPERKKHPDITLAVSPDGRLLAAACGPRVHLWTAASGKPAGTLEGRGGDILAVAFLDGGKTVATADNDGTVVWWDLARGKETARWSPWAGDTWVADDVPWHAGFAQATFAPDGNSLAVQYVGIGVLQSGRMVGTPRSVVVFDLGARKERWRTAGQRGAQFTFAPSGRWLALSVGNSKVEIRNTATGDLRAVHPWERPESLSHHCAALAFTADGSAVAFGANDGRLALWSLDDTTAVRGLLLRGDTRFVRHLAFAADGRTVLVGVGSRLHLADLATGEALCPRSGHRAVVSRVTFAADGRRLTTFGRSVGRDAVLLWDTATWKEIAAPPRVGPPPDCVALSADETLAAVLDGKRLALVAHPGGKRLGTFEPPAGFRTEWGEFSPAGKYFLATTWPKGGEGECLVLLFDVPGGKLRFQTPWIEGDHGSVFSPDESAMATYRSDATMQLRSTADGKVLGTFGRSRQVLQGVRITYTLAFAPDGKAVAQWDDRQDELILWNTATGKVLWELPVAGDFSWIHVAWSPDGRMLAVANAFQGDTIILVEAATGKVRRTLRGHAGRVWSLAFSPDGRLLASGSTDTTVLIWDVYAMER